MRPQIHFTLHLLTGMSVSISAILLDRILPNTPGWGLDQTLTLAVGLGIILLGFFPRLRRVSDFSSNMCVSTLSVFIFIVLCEGFFRIIGYEFSGEKIAWHKVPLYYRQPIVPTGEVYFRRSGPQTWTGQTRYTYLKQHNILPNPYENERVITINYDKNGFRNPRDLVDWDIVVAGDSFTELGFLKFEELFTTILGEILDVNVYNLGISRSGPLTQLSLLKDYGISENTKHAVVVFFEGNDLRELSFEYKDLLRWQNTGERKYREFKSEPSFVRAAYGLIKNLNKSALKHSEPGNPNRYANAAFMSSGGNIPISLAYNPPSRAELSEDQLAGLDYFFREFEKLGKQRGITLWLAYMPSKHRVVHGMTTFNARSTDVVKNWKPNDLPGFISELSSRHGIKFIDLTPELVRVTREQKQLLFSPIWDAHINLKGSEIVGRELARYFKGQL